VSQAVGQRFIANPVGTFVISKEDIDENKNF